MNISITRLVILRIISISLATFLDFFKIQSQQIFLEEYQFLIFSLYLISQLQEITTLFKMADESTHQIQLLFVFINSNLALVNTILLNGNGISMIGNIIIELIILKKYYQEARGRQRKLIQLQPLLILTFIIIHVLVCKQYRNLQSVVIISIIWISDQQNDKIKTINNKQIKNQEGNLDVNKGQENEIYKNEDKNEQIVFNKFSSLGMKFDQQSFISNSSYPPFLSQSKRDKSQSINNFRSQSQQKQKMYQSNKQQYQNKILNLYPYACLVVDQQSNVIYKNQKISKILENKNEQDLMLQLSKIIRYSKYEGVQSPTTKKLQKFISQAFRKKSNSFHQISIFMSNKQINSQNSQFSNPGNDQKSQKSYIQNKKQQQPFLSLSYSFLKFERQVHLKLKLYYDGDDIENNDNQFILIVIKDATVKKQLKIMESQHQFQNSVLESFSHELRTPLNGSIQIIQGLIQSSSIIEQKLLKIVLSCNLLLMHQINDILDSASMENNNFRYNWNVFSLEELVSEILLIYSESMKTKKISFRTNIQDQITQKIKSDKPRILQILINLINNSIKYTNEGGSISLMIQFLEFANCFQIEVQDDGVGINLLTQQKISKMVELSGLSKFKDLDNDNSYIGLGLGICGKLSQGLRVSNESNLKIESFNQMGTKVSFFIQDQDKLSFNVSIAGFTEKDQLKLLKESYECDDISPYDPQQIVIPQMQTSFQQLNMQKQSQKKTCPEIQKQQCKCIQILIVDDVSFNHMALEYLLRLNNLLIDSAFDGEQAIKKVKNKLKQHCPAYKLILMDIEMPIMNGFQATNQIKNLLIGENLKSHIVMCSAYDSQENVDQAYREGMDGVLSKPIRKQNLQNLLMECKILDQK